MAYRSVTVDSTTFYYEVAGQGRPLILLHGLSGSSRWWARNVGSLAQHFQVYTIDLIGFGHSRGQPFALHDMSRLLAQWMDRVGLREAHIAGHSMGGYIAADLAVAYPERVDHLVLAAALAAPLDRPFRQGLGLVRALRYMTPNFLPVMFADAFRCGPVTLLRAIRDVFQADLRRALPAIQAPALVVWGDKDRMIPLEMGRFLHQQLPHSQLVVLPGAGHTVMWDRPEQFNQAVVSFLTAKARP